MFVVIGCSERFFVGSWAAISYTEQNAVANPGNHGLDFQGERRTNRNHRSIIVPESRSMRKDKGKEANFPTG